MSNKHKRRGLAPDSIAQYLVEYYDSQVNDPTGQRECLTMWRQISDTGKGKDERGYRLAVLQIEGRVNHAPLV